MTYIVVPAEKLIKAVKEKKDNILQETNKKKEYVIQLNIEEKVGFFWNRRNRSREDAENEVNLWWPTKMSLEGYTADLRHLSKLEELAYTSIKEGDGNIHLNKEDNHFIFEEIINNENQ
jgi:hypothetical protein